MRKRAEELQVGDHIFWAPSNTNVVMVSNVHVNDRRVETEISYDDGTTEWLTWNHDSTVWLSE